MGQTFPPFVFLLFFFFSLQRRGGNKRINPFPSFPIFLFSPQRGEKMTPLSNFFSPLQKGSWERRKPLPFRFFFFLLSKDLVGTPPFFFHFLFREEEVGKRALFPFLWAAR